MRGIKKDLIEFKVNTDIDYNETPEGIPWKHTDIIINEESLFDSLRSYESFEAQRTKTNVDIAGKYIGIDPQDLNKICTSGNKDNFSAWQCSTCRSSLCASNLVCKYKITPFTIELYDFRQQSNPMPLNQQKLHNATIEKSKWNYSAFGPFKFDRISFFKEMSKVVIGS